MDGGRGGGAGGGGGGGEEEALRQRLRRLKQKGAPVKAEDGLAERLRRLKGLGQQQQQHAGEPELRDRFARLTEATSSGGGAQAGGTEAEEAALDDAVEAYLRSGEWKDGNCEGAGPGVLGPVPDGGEIERIGGALGAELSPSGWSQGLESEAKNGCSDDEARKLLQIAMDEQYLEMGGILSEKHRAPPEPSNANRRVDSLENEDDEVQKLIQMAVDEANLERKGR